MDKVAVKKEQIIQDVTQHVIAHGLSDLGLRKLAAVGGTSDRMLIYYFGTKDALIGTVLQAIAAGLTLKFDAALGTHQRDAESLLAELIALGNAPEFDAILRLWFEVVGLAARGQSPYAENAQAIGRNWLNWIQSRLVAEDVGQAKNLFAQLEGTLMFNLLELGRSEA